MLAGAHFLPFAASAFNALEPIKWRKEEERKQEPTTMTQIQAAVTEKVDTVKTSVQKAANWFGFKTKDDTVPAQEVPTAPRTEFAKKAAASVLTDGDFWLNTLRIAVVTISLLTLAMRVAHVQEVRGSAWAVIYALIVITLSVTITQHLMKLMVTHICRDVCGKKRRILLAVILVCLAAGADHLIFNILK